jgi:hypothetical protein
MQSSTSIKELNEQARRWNRDEHCSYEPGSESFILAEVNLNVCNGTLKLVRHSWARLLEVRIGLPMPSDQTMLGKPSSQHESTGMREP